MPKKGCGLVRSRIALNGAKRDDLQPNFFQSLPIETACLSFALSSDPARVIFPRR
jgi:hypothetical protein